MKRETVLDRKQTKRKGVIEMKARKIMTIIAAMLCMILLLAACDSGNGNQTDSQGAANGKKASETLVLKVGDSEIYLNEVNYYALSFRASMQITDESDLDAAFSQEYPTMDDAMKAQFLLTLRQTYILYQKAIEADVTLTEDELAEVDTLVQNYIESTDQETLDKYELDNEVLTHIFTVYQTIQKFEQQLAAEVDTEHISYGTYYNFVFLTVEVDEDGNAVTNDDGSYVYLSEEEQEQQKALAEEVRARIADGEDAETMIEEYDLSSTSGVVHATTDSLNETYGLKDGETSEILEESFGYIFVQIESLEDEEYSQNAYDYNNSSETQDYLEETEQAWFDEYTINDEDLEQDVWDAFTFKDFV